MLGTCSTYPKTCVARGTHNGARLTSRAHLASHVLRCPRGSMPRRAAQKPHTTLGSHVLRYPNDVFGAKHVARTARRGARLKRRARLISSHVLRCPNVSLEQGALSSAPRRAAQTPRASSARMCCGDQMPFWSQARCKNSTPRRAAQTPSAASTRICCDTRIGLWTKAR